MTPSQLTRTMNWVAMFIALVLLAMVAYQIYLRHFLPLSTGAVYQFDDLPTLSKAPVTANIDAIVDAHIFGQVPEALEAAPAVVEEPVARPVPKTRLNIKLTGIIDSDSPESGIAMLEVDRGRTLVVTVGEKIGKTDAILHQVLPGEVLLDRDGTIESVKMVRKTLSLAKLDSTLMDSLPQPYIERTDTQTEQGRETNPGAADIYGSPSPAGNGKTPAQSSNTQNYPGAGVVPGISWPSGIEKPVVNAKNHATTRSINPRPKTNNNARGTYTNESPPMNRLPIPRSLRKN